ncbi:MAG: cell division protein ZapE [Pseudomonadota bacterium]
MTSKTPESLSELYAARLAEKDWQADDAQWQTIKQLDRLRDALIDYENSASRRRWWHFDAVDDAPKGLYLWGGVGRGKTFMMDLFVESLPFDVVRSHFHRFMYDVHASLKKMDGRRDPLPQIAKRLSERTRVLCFDEFFVSDIGDAMILGRLTTALFEYGVVLVATSNIPPDELYKDGLQRARFLPAIEEINRHCDVLHVDAGVDYRLRLLDQAPMFYTPSDDPARQAMKERFANLAETSTASDDPILINGREIDVITKAGGIAWFDFDTLCRGPRSQNDYIALSTRLHTVMLSEVPQMDGSDDNAARRFIALIDEFYERRVNLMIAADVPLAELYAGEKLAFEFERTSSRLIEMQSEEYLSSMRKK